MRICSVPASSGTLSDVVLDSHILYWWSSRSDRLSTAAVQAIAAADQTWPEGLHRCCYLYFDPQTSWPCRVEWRGPNERNGVDVSLLQMEFRDPLLNRALTPAQCRHEFTFDPATAKVVDQTQQVAESLKEQSAKQ